MGMTSEPRRLGSQKGSEVRASPAHSCCSAAYVLVPQAWRAGPDHRDWGVAVNRPLGRRPYAKATLARRHMATRMTRKVESSAQ